MSIRQMGLMVISHWLWLELFGKHSGKNQTLATGPSNQGPAAANETARKTSAAY
ncbi:hypothetical protein ACTJLC_10020 [Paraburkholderia sp. 22099]|uniref:hypothetical protein n=1 Tax=Paraburkholderia TaxID=1822464 RepID=UPI002857F57B|nr:hypothetical protein [Paraburkholderia terricola]MDR6444209.1 hypothetical protein [Paraburkholderia terricola]MDR6491720.1 hypothetical protein [Paraburkholderia terricola]